MLQVAAGLAVEIQDVETVIDEDRSWRIARQQKALGLLLRTLAFDLRRFHRRYRLSCTADRRSTGRKPRYHLRRHRLPSVNLVSCVQNSKKLRRPADRFRRTEDQEPIRIQ